MFIMKMYIIQPLAYYQNYLAFKYIIMIDSYHQVYFTTNGQVYLFPF